MLIFYFLIVLSIVVMIFLASASSVFPFFFVIHLLSGRLSDLFGLTASFISPIGMVNILVLLYFLVKHWFVRAKQLIVPYHNYSKLVIALICAYVIPQFIVDTNIGSAYKLISYFGAIISIYYLTQIYLESKSIEENCKRNIFFSRFILYLFSILGVYNALSVGLSFESAYDKKFKFVFFEYPHSFSVFMTAIMPLMYYFLRKVNKNPIDNIFIFFVMPLSVYFGGSRLGFMIYAISLSLITVYDLRLSKVKILKFLAPFLIVMSVYGFFASPVYKHIQTVFDYNLDYYINHAYGFKINSLHSRIAGWVYVYDRCVNKDRFWSGMGWRAWDQELKMGAIVDSLQSDYATVFFESGFIGLIGIIVFRIGIIFILIRLYIRTHSFVVMGGIIGISVMYIASFTENIDGYASTSWLVPVLMAYSFCHAKLEKKVS